MAQLKAAVIAQFGKTSPLLAQFGFAYKSRTPLTPEAAVAKKVRQQQTRLIRNTLGPKEKAKLKFTGQVVVSTTAGAAPAAAVSAGTPVSATAPAAGGSTGTSGAAQAPATAPGSSSAS